MDNHEEYLEGQRSYQAVTVGCHWTWLRGYGVDHVVGREELEEDGSAEEIMMPAGYLMVTARSYESGCYL